MSKASRYRLFFAAVICLLLAPPLAAAEGIKGHLVSVDWLESHLKDPEVLVLDASPSPMYAAQHIPGAVNVDLFTYGGREVPISEMEQRFQSWGISAGRKIVLYDQGAPMMAASPRRTFSSWTAAFPSGWPREGASRKIPRLPLKLALSAS
jgi:hypothetical protein